MPIKTNLNIDPFFDDFDASKKYYRVLFKPGYALQARELTQLQTTLQNQIEEFGDNIFKEGSIVRGCNFTELTDLKYVKVTDDIDPLDYIERTVELEDGTIREYYYELVDDNDLRAVIITAAAGFVSQTPDLNTFFIRYLNSTDAGVQEFTAGGNLTVEEFYIETDANTEVETVVGPTANLNVTTTVAPSLTNPVGDSFGLTVAEGVVYQRGHFLYVDEQTIVVTKYVTDDAGEPIDPNDRNCGFYIDESIVTSQIDTSLADNATGSPNERAPGADRLMLVPRLVALDTSVADADSDFFTLVRYQNGQAVQIRDVSQYNVIGDVMSTRTSEAHGDFTINEFSFDILRQPWTWDADGDANTANTTTNEITAVMGPGVAYINGYRIENKAEQSFRINPIANTDTETLNDQIVSFDMGTYKTVTDSNGWVGDIRSGQYMELLDANSTVIGSMVIKGLSKERVYPIPGTIRMDTGKKFRWVVGLQDPNGGGGVIEFDYKSLVPGVSDGLIFDTDVFAAKSLSNFRFPVRNFQTGVAVAANGTITLNVKPNVNEPEIFTADSLNDVFVVANNSVSLGVSNTSLSGNSLIIDTDAGGANTVTVYYNAEIQPDAPLVKQSRQAYVTFHYLDSKSNYTLGLPDVYSLVSVVGDDGVDYTNSFKLEDNQHANWYDHSFLIKRPHRVSPPNGTLLTVSFMVYEVDFTTGAANFFTIDSYANTTVEELLPVARTDGTVLDLRNCVDFRPYRIADITIETDANSAPYIANTATHAKPAYNVELFANTASYFFPAFDTVGTLDYTYYLGRTDAICVDAGGNFSLVEGEAATNPIPPEVKDKAVLAHVTVPGRPALTEEEATDAGLEKLAVTVTGRQITPTYTMKDIADIDKQVQRLTYYTTLTMLEQATKDLSIKDSDGLNRFKNGIYVDTFDDLQFAKLGDTEFDASIDEGEGTMGPALDTFQLKLRRSSTSNTSIFDADDEEEDTVKIATLATNAEKRVIAQPYATSIRPVSTGAFKYIGRVYLQPDFSSMYNYWTKPKIARALRKEEKGIATESDVNLQKYVSYTSTSKSWHEDVRYDNLNGQTTNRKDNVSTTVYSLKNSTADTKGKIGSGYVLSERMIPFMAANRINVRIWGLRPNTRHYFFFDRRNVTDYVRPAKNVNGKFTPYGKFGNSVKSDANGKLLAEFKLTGGTFYCGSRFLNVMDVDDWDSRKAATSRGRQKYTAYQYSIRKTGSTPSLRRVEYDFNKVETNKSVANRSVNVTDDDVEANSPLAQTFFVKRQMTGGAECIHLSKINLYFRRKSATSGVRIDIREVQNGYPTTDILPFSSVHLERSDVNVSSDGTVATTFTFDAPIRVDAEKEYAIVVQADADDPDYQLFTSKAGQRNKSNNKKVNQDWGDGTLFSATNGSAWKSYQSEDMKFDIYRYFFSAQTGTVTMESNQYEFFTIEDTLGEFEQDELVYTIKDANTIFYVTLDEDSDEVTANASMADFSVGDWIFITNPAANTSIEPENVLVKVDGTLGANSVSIRGGAPWTGTFEAQKAVAGRVEIYNPDDNQNITLRYSSAKTGRVFSAGDTILGIDSSANAVITSVDDITIGYGQLVVETLTDSTTDIKAVGRFISPDAPADPRYSQALSMKKDNLFLTHGGVLCASKSNDPDGDKNVKVRFDLSRISNAELGERNGPATPMLDLQSATLNAYRYRINGTYTPAWVSKDVHLAEGFEAEDFKLWLTAHRPHGTNIRVYIRVRNDADDTPLRDIDWIEMTMTEGSNLYVPKKHRTKFKEYAFEVPDSAKANGIIEYSDDSGDFLGFNVFSVKIVLESDVDNIVPRVSDVRGVAFE